MPLEPLNLSWITATLAIGGGFAPDDTARLADEHDVRAVVDLRGEARDEDVRLAALDIAFLHLPTPDLGAVSLRSLDAGVAFVRPVLERGERVLIHCQHGIGRSATLALCVLVDGGMAPLEALELAKSRRDRVSPSPAQFEAFVAWLGRHRAARAVAWTAPSFDAFAAIAYRHLRAAAPT